MANAKRLTDPQIAALRAAARSENLRAHNARVVDALIKRGLVFRVWDTGATYHFEIAAAGRQALFEATGSWGTQETPDVKP